MYFLGGVVLGEVGLDEREPSLLVLRHIIVTDFLQLLIDVLDVIQGVVQIDQENSDVEELQLRGQLVQILQIVSIMEIVLEDNQIPDVVGLLLAWFDFSETVFIDAELLSIIIVDEILHIFGDTIRIGVFRVMTL